MPATFVKTTQEVALQTLEEADNAVRVKIVGGAGSGGTSATDEATYTPASSAGTPVMAAVDETTPDAAAEGTLAIVRATLNRALHVNLRDTSGNEVAVGGGTQYNDGAARGSATGTLALGDDGVNLQSLSTDASGKLLVKVEDGGNVLSVDDAGSTLSIDDGAGSITVDGTVTVNAGTDLNTSALALESGGNLATIASAVKSEDAIHNSGDVGVMALAVRKDTGGALSSADGDYTPLQIDASGNLRVNVAAGGAGDGAILDGVSSSIKATVLDYTNSNPIAVRLSDTNGDYVAAGAGTQYTEDAAAAADPVGGALIMVRDDVLSAQTSADGDNVAARGTDKGELYVKHVDAIPVTDNGSTLSIDDGAGSITVDGSVSLAAELPAGTNNIGDVDVLSLPSGTVAGSSSLPAGTNNIGDVDVLTLPALPAGTNNIGDVDVLTLPALPAGTNNIGDVDIASAIPAGSNLVGRVNPEPQTANGLSISRVLSAASTNATSVKGSAGQVYTIYAHNINAAVRYLKLYNKATAPTVGTDTPVMTLPIPGNTAGAGFVLDTGGMGIVFGTGIALALTTGLADADTGAVAANEIVVNILYK